MPLTKRIQVVYMSCYIIVCSWGLKSPDEDIILETESTVRNSMDFLFSNLNLDKNCPKVTQKMQMHNFFTNVTLMTHRTYKLIVTLTRVDKNIDSELYTFVLKEVLHDFQNNMQANIYKKHNKGSTEYMEDFLNDLEKLVNNSDIAYDDIEIIDEINAILQNNYSTEQDTVLRAHQDTESDSFEDNNNLRQDELHVSDPERRVFKGEITKIKKFPFMASIHMFNQFQCAGSIIMSDLILTAASCLQQAWDNKFYLKNPSFITVRVGTDYFNQRGDTMPVMEIYFHPGYNSVNLEDNLAILKLQKHLMLKKNKVQKIEIDREGKSLSMMTKSFTLIGWGSKRPGNVLIDVWSNRLSKAVLDIYDHEECEVVYSKEYVTDKNFCAGFVAKGSGACNHDVGDPGLLNGILVGVVSFGAPVCGTPDAPTVFTKVSLYADWIKSVMKQNNPKDEEASDESSTSYPTTSFFNFDLELLTNEGSTIMGPISTTRETRDEYTFRDFRSKMYQQYKNFLLR